MWNARKLSRIFFHGWWVSLFIGCGIAWLVCPRSSLALDCVALPAELSLTFAVTAFALLSIKAKDGFRLGLVLFSCGLITTSLFVVVWHGLVLYLGAALMGGTALSGSLVSSLSRLAKKYRDIDNG